METQTLSFIAGRKVILAPFTGTVDFEVPRPFVALLPATNTPDCKLAEEIVVPLIAIGCIEICCVGAIAEQVHDKLDDIIESSGNTEVVTTWFNDKHDACEYFLCAAGGGSLSLLALILNQPEFVNILIKAGGGSMRRGGAGGFPGTPEKIESA